MVMFMLASMTTTVMIAMLIVTLVVTMQTATVI
jgi:hypothetical protein